GAVGDPCPRAELGGLAVEFVDRHEGFVAKTRIVGMELRQRALDALCCADPGQKVAMAAALGAAAAQSTPSPHAPAPAQHVPGRPARPELIHPAKVPRRSPA